MRKAAVIAGAAVALTGAIALAIYAVRLAAIGTAYSAKILCSAISFRGAIRRRSLQPTSQWMISRSFVTSTCASIADRARLHREGFGCSLIHPGTEPRAAATFEQPARRESARDRFESTEALPQLRDLRLNAIVEQAFAEPDAARPRRTRAVVVVHKDRLIVERYADGFTKDTPLIGWSMAKSVANALVGILVQEGKLALGDPVALPEWRAPGDPRSKITWDQLLRMTSGLEFREDYSDPLADVTYMLLAVPNAGAYAAEKRLESQPGTRWDYSSGTTNIIAYAARRIVGDSNYVQWPKRALFDRLGMTRAVMETDAAGNFVASSFMYATARDWARFGLLYLHDGVWSGQRILPQGWVRYSRTPVAQAPDKRFGAHFWLSVPEHYRCASEAPALPPDAFHAIGHEGQFVTIIPSRELVLVRLGLTRYPCAWDHQRFAYSVLEALQ
jgi:CubicO group peptidase (beta-lactamase class C family)